MVGVPIWVNITELDACVFGEPDTILFVWDETTFCRSVDIMSPLAGDVIGTILPATGCLITSPLAGDVIGAILPTTGCLITSPLAGDIICTILPTTGCLITSPLAGDIICTILPTTGCLITSSLADVIGTILPTTGWLVWSRFSILPFIVSVLFAVVLTWLSVITTQTPDVTGVCMRRATVNRKVWPVIPKYVVDNIGYIWQIRFFCVIQLLA